MIKYLLYVLNITISFAFCCKKEGVDKGCCCCKGGDSSKKSAGLQKTKSISGECERRINDTNLSSQANNVDSNGLLNPFNNAEFGNGNIQVPPINNNLSTFNNNNNLNNNTNNNNNLNTNNNSNNNNNLNNNISNNNNLNNTFNNSNITNNNNSNAFKNTNNRTDKKISPFNGDTMKMLDNKMNNNNSYNNNSNNNFYMNNNNINNNMNNNINNCMNKGICSANYFINNNNFNNNNSNINNNNNNMNYQMNNNMNFYNNNNLINMNNNMTNMNNNITNMNSNMINMNNNRNNINFINFINMFKAWVNTKMSQNQPCNSLQDIWWEQAGSNINNILNVAMNNAKNVDFSNRSKYFKQISAGVQSDSCCGIFAMQNVQNYFLHLAGKGTISNSVYDPATYNNAVIQVYRKNGGIWDETSDQPGVIDATNIIEYFGKINLGSRYVAIESLNRPDVKKRDTASKILQFLLLTHFFYSETPVITRILSDGVQHYITVCAVGRDNNNKIKALVLDSKPKTSLGGVRDPEIVDLCQLCNDIPMCKNGIDNGHTSLLIFASNIKKDYLMLYSRFADNIYNNWDTFIKHVALCLMDFK